MNAIPALLAAVLATTPNTLQIKADRAEIRLSPKRDTTIRFLVTKKSVESFELPESVERFETSSESSVELSLKNEAPDGAFELSLKHGPIKGSFLGGDSKEAVPFDSEKPEVTDKATKDRDLARMLKSETIDGGIEVALKLARDAEVLEVKGYADAIKPKIDAMYDDDRIDVDEVKLARAHGSDAHFQQALINVLPRLPRNAVAVGDEFTLERGWHECPTESTCFEIALKCRVSALDAETISVDVQGEMPRVADLDENAIERVTLRTFEIRGKLVFSRRDGFLRTLEVEQTAEAAVPMTHGVLPMKKTVSIQYRRAN